VLLTEPGQKQNASEQVRPGRSGLDFQPFRRHWQRAQTNTCGIANGIANCRRDSDDGCFPSAGGGQKRVQSVAPV